MPEQATLKDGRVITRYRDRPSYDALLSSTMLWLSVGIVGVVTAAFRHQER